MISSQNAALFIFTSISLIAGVVGFVLHLTTKNVIYEKALALTGCVALLFSVAFLDQNFSDNSIYLHNMHEYRVTGSWPNSSEEKGFVALITLIANISINDWLFYQLYRVALVFAKLYVIFKFVKNYSLALVFYIPFVFCYNDLITIRSSNALLFIYIGLLFLSKRSYVAFSTSTLSAILFHTSAAFIIPPLIVSIWLFLYRFRQIIYIAITIIPFIMFYLSNMLDVIVEYYSSTYIAEKMDFYQYYVDIGETNSVSIFRPVQWYFFCVALLFWRRANEKDYQLISTIGMIFVLLAPIVFLAFSFSPVVSGRLQNMYFALAVFSVIGQSRGYQILFAIGCLLGYFSLIANGHFMR